MNGIYANLEINDSVLKNLFEELASKHYVDKNWEALIRNKFRLRFQMAELLPEIISAFDNNAEFAKYMRKINRFEVLSALSFVEFSFPITMNNIVFFINTFFFRDNEILAITPQIFISEFESCEFYVTCYLSVDPPLRKSFISSKIVGDSEISFLHLS